MCGIVACRSDASASDYLLPALERLEYRGYDSAGIAVLAGDGSLRVLRAVGRLAALKEAVGDYTGPELDGTGIGHTRWATHGGVSLRNAHPHLSCDGSVAVVHNGIIENAAVLRRELEQQGHRFASDVDSEVIAHLVEDGVRRGADLADAVRSAVRRLRGSWAVAVLQRSSSRIVVTAERCPLVVGRSPAGDFAASDTAAVLPWVETVRVLRDGDLVDMGAQLRWSGVDGPRTRPDPVRLEWRPEDALLGEHPDFMAKEIGEQPEVAARILDGLRGRVTNGRLWSELGLPPVARVRVLACGTSLNAGRTIAGVFETAGSVPSRCVVASEGAGDLVEPGTVTLAISQSGETADVLHALDAAGGVPDAVAPLVTITNNVHSSLARRASAVVSCHAGPEIGVAATKTFTAQVVVGAGLALSALVCAGRLSRRDAERHMALLEATPERLAEADRTASQRVPEQIGTLTDAPGFLFLARGAALPYAAEGALKLQEISYRWAHAYPAGELKHGPIALIEPGVPVIAIDHGDPRMATNLAEVAARGARVLDIGGPGSVLPLLGERPVRAPWGPLEAALGLQHLARSLAVALGRDVDKPRNLAKSVTVE